ncbi:MAG: hypothetical protein KDD28_33855, partial [Phaeodactylibacter sp.]|nr:hypothetical protein [Phaeodactylibacter sp.]
YSFLAPYWIQNLIPIGVIFSSTLQLSLQSQFGGYLVAAVFCITDGSGTYLEEFVAAVARWPWGWYSNPVDDGRYWSASQGSVDYA